jgi:hypothetical protein
MQHKGGRYVAKPEKIKVTSVQQVCIVVKDTMKAVEAFWNILGIGPWNVFTFGSPKVADLKYRGKRVYVPSLGAVTQCGPIELELFQDVDGKSVYTEWIEEQGEGLHHLKFLTDDMDIDKVDRYMEWLGFPNIQCGHFGPELKNQFSYYDTRKALKCIWETSNRSGGKPPGAVQYPSEPNAVSPAKVKVKGLKQVGIVVKDVIRTAENYWDILGIGPWEIRDWGNRVLWDRTYMGKPAWGRERLAHAYLGDLELELLQPVEGDSIYADWIEEHGEGLHHLKFLCDDIDATSQALAEQGFQSIQSGHFGDPAKKEGGFNYFDIPPLHCIFEPVHKPKSLPIEPIAIIPPKK